MKRIICLYGGPCTGKTTTMAATFALLKMRGKSGDMNPEYVKGWVWEERKINPGDQTYFFSKMAKRERHLMKNEVDFIITDSPLILTHYYGLKYDIFEQAHNTSLKMLGNHHEICKHYGYKVEHYVLQRGEHYDPKGRYQTKEEAIALDSEIEDMLTKVGIKYKTITGADNMEMAHRIVDDLLALEAAENKAA